MIRLDRGAHRELMRRAQANGTSMSEEVMKLLGMYELQLPIPEGTPNFEVVENKYQMPGVSPEVLAEVAKPRSSQT